MDLKAARFSEQKSGDLRTFLIAALACIFVIEAPAARPAGQNASPLPSRFDSYLKTVVKLSPEKRSQLLAGGPVTELLETDPSKEVSVFGAVWVRAPIARYVAAVKNIEAFEKGENFLVTKRISSPPRLEDFEKLSIPQDDFADDRSIDVARDTHRHEQHTNCEQLCRQQRRPVRGAPAPADTPKRDSISGGTRRGRPVARSTNTQSDSAVSAGTSPPLTS